MEKRVFVAVIISVAFLWGWAALAPRFFPELAKQKTATTETSSAAPASSRSVSPALSPAGRPAHAPAAAAVPATPLSASSLELTRIDTPEFSARFTNRGAQLASFQLTHYTDKDGRAVELVKARDTARGDFPFSIEMKDPVLAARLNTALYTVDQHTESGQRVLTYRYTGTDGVSATKIFHFSNEYLFSFSVTITPAVPFRVMTGPGLRTLAPDEKDSQFIITGNGVVQRNDDLKVIRREKADALAIYERTQFIGVEDNYFLTAFKPEHAGDAIMRSIDVPVPGSKDKRREIYVGLNAAADGGVAGAAFFGPKQTDLLEKYGFERTLQFGFFGPIAKLLLIALVWFNKFTHNYGFAIIVLTIVIKILLYPLQHKSMVSMKSMQRVQPKVKAIQDRYKKAKSDPDQRQRMNVEVMNLYKQEGVNPMGGCLPMVIQIPILWAFYGALSKAIELRGQPFIWWIHDLSIKDPYYITPILMAATQYISQSLTPTTVDPAQKRMFQFMPIIFFFIMKEFPSGLVLYWLVQNVLTIIQQMIMNRYWKDHPEEVRDLRPTKK